MRETSATPTLKRLRLLKSAERLFHSSLSLTLSENSFACTLRLSTLCLLSISPRFAVRVPPFECVLPMRIVGTCARLTKLLSASPFDEIRSGTFGVLAESDFARHKVPQIQKQNKRPEVFRCQASATFFNVHAG